MAVFFISDLHLGHQRMLSFGQRKFETIEEHDDALISAWNARVKKKDKVFVLGDIAFKKAALLRVGELVGLKELIIGNHDQFQTHEYLKYFHKVHGVRKYKDFILSHVPLHPDEMRFNWKWNVHGHIHDPTRNIKDPRYFNVCVDNIGMTPLTYEEVLRKIQLKGLGY